ncbi:lactate/malate family dehydrogenase [Tepidibacter thalassicus]|uniref:Malate/lactate dehydrogenase n=1 Tax=Tepidibacter thalassicus DSM 15285 TaxID=1123350 RepID=A0A1M5PGY2_9FIRM|nr:lactate dehydrogenase [Tepidibacter thalassicus]SHH01020.1 Malate/lactate dehydrogenase [Tepidibacter thalassicus DSM 15285]
MYFYKFKNKILFSLIKYDNLNEINENEAKKSKCLYYLNKLNPLKSRKMFNIYDSSLLFIKEEGINLIHRTKNCNDKIPNWILEKIKQRNIIGINTNYPNWENILNYKHPNKWKINIVGLGDVGSTLLIGLRLLGDDCISEIGLYGLNENNLQRLEYEINQIIDPFNNQNYPDIKILKEKDIFNCDMFIFCASKNVPSIKEKVKDVRMMQFEENSKIISYYAKKARDNNFNGLFAVVSDPVDLLCKVAFISSNKNENNNIDFNGLSPEQIRGYGLGVMNARAIYYSRQNTKTHHYIKEGRAFGPHGKDLIIADSIKNYNNELSLYLTEKAINANIDVRNTGFKPYIAPALSSGALSIIATIKGNWHYSSTYMGEVFMGAKNRLLPSGTEIEMLNLPNPLLERIKSTYNKLNNIDCSKF